MVVSSVRGMVEWPAVLCARACGGVSGVHCSGSGGQGLLEGIREVRNCEEGAVDVEEQSAEHTIKQSMSAFADPPYQAPNHHSVTATPGKIGSEQQ